MLILTSSVWMTMHRGGNGRSHDADSKKIEVIELSLASGERQVATYKGVIQTELVSLKF